MTVSELCDKFECLFHKIVYFDKVQNIQDVIYCGAWDDYAELCNFLDDYDNYEVIDWSYNFVGNSLYVEVQ